MYSGNKCLAIIIARAGSVGLPNKNFLPLLGKPVLAYSIEHALQAKHIDHIVVSSDSEEAKAIAKANLVAFMQRPADLTTQETMCVNVYRDVLTRLANEETYIPSIVVPIYGNIPVRPPGGIDKGIELFVKSNASSVQSVEDIGRCHPFWAQSLDEKGRMQKFIGIQKDYHNRQMLPPVYALNGAIFVCRRSLIMHDDAPSNAGWHLGTNRYGMVTEQHECIDIDFLADLYMAEAALRARQGNGPMEAPLPLQDGYPLDITKPYPGWIPY